MGKFISSHIYRAFNNLSMQGLKFTHVSKRGHNRLDNGNMDLTLSSVGHIHVWDLTLAIAWPGDILVFNCIGLFVATFFTQIQHDL